MRRRLWPCLASAVISERDVVRRIGEAHLRLAHRRAASRHPLACGIAAHHTVLAELEEVARLRPGILICGPQSFVQVQALRSVTFVPGLKSLDELRDLLVLKSGKREVKIRSLGKVSKQSGKKLLVEVAADLVQGHVQKLGLFLRDIEVDDRDGAKSQPAGGKEALVAADHGSVRRSSR